MPPPAVPRAARLPPSSLPRPPDPVSSLGAARGEQALSAAEVIRLCSAAAADGDAHGCRRRWPRWRRPPCSEGSGGHPLILDLGGSGARRHALGPAGGGPPSLQAAGLMSVATSWGELVLLSYVMSGMFVLLPQRFRFHVLELIGQPCMNVVALFIKRGESLFREGMVRPKEAVPRSVSSMQ
jgi:hypothetical protein